MNVPDLEAAAALRQLASLERERSIRSLKRSVASRILDQLKGLAIGTVVAFAAYATYVAAGVRASDAPQGTMRGLQIGAPVSILRDDRGVPHIRARSERDAFFAEGYVQAADRLFQMDLYRRYIYGQLSEMLGPIQLPRDEMMRAFDARDVVNREWRHLPARSRDDLQAFSDGVNAARSTLPLPLEFRLLLYSPRPWVPQDSLAVTLAISVSLGDSVEDVLRRDAIWRARGPAGYAGALPLSDPAYDVSTSGARESAPRSAAAPVVSGLESERGPQAERFGSNAWAAGAAYTKSGRALLANDPHLTLSVPGVWYVVEMRAPGFHVAGVTVPGVPGVILGHNERLAWATTNAMAASFSVFEGPRAGGKHWQLERFHVRFARDAVKAYYRTASEFGVPAATRHSMVLVRWPPYTAGASAIETVFALDRAQNIGEAMKALAHYTGPAQNFVFADDGGRVAYHLAGPIPNDPVWERYVHPARDAHELFAPVPFAQLPFSGASRSQVVVSANNKMYGTAYRFRLSPMFAPPYRAYRIAELLHRQRGYSVRSFAAMQLDVESPADVEFAHRVAAYARERGELFSNDAIAQLMRWNGAFAPQSRTATFVHDLRSAADDSAPSPYWIFEAMRADRVPAELEDDWRQIAARDANGAQFWANAGAVQLLHPFGPIGFPFLNGGTLPGSGEEYTVHVQDDTLSQSFRAVWQVPDWDEGGLSIPAGESGRIGSRHYEDLRERWIRGDLEPLPFSDRAVERAARSRTLLMP